jgi:hypothetical protein
VVVTGTRSTVVDSSRCVRAVDGALCSRHDQCSLHCIQYDPSLACALRRNNLYYYTLLPYIYLYISDIAYIVFDIWQHAPPSPKIQTLNGGFLLLPADNTVDVCYQQLMPASSYTVVCNRVRRRESLVCFRVSYIPNSPTPYYRDVHYSSLLVFCWHLVVSAYYTYTLHTYTVLESAES